MTHITIPLINSQLIRALGGGPTPLHHNNAPRLHRFRSRIRVLNHERSKHFGNGYVTEFGKTGPVKMDFVVEFIQVSMKKKFRNDVLFELGLRHGNGTIENLSGFAPTNYFIKLKVRGWKSTCCPSPCMTGKQ